MHFFCAQQREHSKSNRIVKGLHSALMLYAEFQITHSCAAHCSSWADFVTLHDTQAVDNDDLFKICAVERKVIINI